VSIDGNAGTVTNGFYTTSSIYLGSTLVAANRSNVALSLTGVSIDGLAGSATKLATPQTINGVAFDGTSAITVTTDAGTLTGTVLKSTVVTSNLTSVGTLTSVSSSGVISTTDTTNTNNSNASTGSIKTAGGAAITKDLYVGQNAYIIGNLTVTGNITDTAGNVIVQAGDLTVSGKVTASKTFSIAMAAAMA
jgi:hypothetical protein